ncbi:hypothetical protein U2P60_13245 [Brucella sp. H1_1004]|uniref:Y-family DNA polymerase n=1 Tax=Brucella sp. H1_1004 TaxID=3110109 RepID=UPI0039B48F6C
MRLPKTIERLYLDFDGFFAPVEQQCDKRLRGRPIGVVPFEGTNRTAVIACSKEAKAMGVKNVMPINDALRVCPDIILVPQKPDLYQAYAISLMMRLQLAGQPKKQQQQSKLFRRACIAVTPAQSQTNNVPSNNKKPRRSGVLSYSGMFGTPSSLRSMIRTSPTGLACPPPTVYVRDTS